MQNCWAFLLKVHFYGKKQVARVKQCVSFKLSLLRRIRKYLLLETRILFLQLLNKTCYIILLYSLGSWV